MFGFFAIGLFLFALRGCFRVALAAGFAEVALLEATFLEVAFFEVSFAEVFFFLMA
jgi:hypothetical protein